MATILPETAVDKSRKLFSVRDEYMARLPRDRKFAIGDRLLESGLTVMECVVEAFYSPKQAKAPLLKRVNIHLEVIRQLVRYLLENKTHDIKKHEHLFPNIFYNQIPGIGKKSRINQENNEKNRWDLTDVSSILIVSIVPDILVTVTEVG